MPRPVPGARRPAPIEGAWLLSLQALAEAAQENDAILEINLNENPLGSTENPLKKTDAGRQARMTVSGGLWPRSREGLVGVAEAWCRIWERCKAMPGRVIWEGRRWETPRESRPTCGRAQPSQPDLFGSVEMAHPGPPGGFQ